MNKFIYRNASDITRHWEFCNQNKYPFATINNTDRNFNEIPSDITNISDRLEEVSNSVREISYCYNNFFLIPDYISERYESQHYYFEFPVMNTHFELTTNQLFNYLLDNIGWNLFLQQITRPSEKIFRRPILQKKQLRNCKKDLGGNYQYV